MSSREMVVCVPDDAVTVPAARAAIHSFWEQEGAEYDARPDHGIASDSERQLWTAVLSAIPQSSRVLDVGTGTGFVALLLAGLGHRVTGVDASEAMLANARAKAAGHGAAITFQRGAAEQLPFGDACFDAVTARHLIWTLPEPGRAFAEWRRVLVAGGTLVADCSLDPQIAGYHYSSEVVAALPFRGVSDPSLVADALRSAGFVQVEVEILDVRDGLDRRAMLRARTAATHGPDRTT